MLDNKRVLLIISGGIAAYKSLEFIRRLKDRGCQVRCILTGGGAQFVTLCPWRRYRGKRSSPDLFSLTDEAEMGHIRLSREADLVAVAPASADILAKMAAGLADDLATTALLATDKPVLVAPAMNMEMWAHPATQRNIDTLKMDGIRVIGPAAGDLACGETGPGRMVEPDELLEAVEACLSGSTGGTLAGRRVLVTSGPTVRPSIPCGTSPTTRPVSKGMRSPRRWLRWARNHAGLGTHPGNQPTGVTMMHVESAEDMLAACESVLPVDVAVCAAAVSDWRAASREAQKIKKGDDDSPSLKMVENPDILATLARHPRHRPTLVVGFAAETENLIGNATQKRLKKACDWIVANDVSGATGTFGASDNTVHLITERGAEAWPKLSKALVADRLGQAIADYLARERPAA